MNVSLTDFFSGATSLSSSLLGYMKPDIASKLKLLKCQNHPDKVAQFVNRSIQNGKFLCEECGPREDTNAIVDVSSKNYRGDYIKVEQLLDYINEEYTRLKRKSVSIGLPIPRFEEFLLSRDALTSTISKALIDNQNVIIDRLEALRIEFNKMIDLHKSFVTSMYSREIKQFETNAKFLTTRIEGFLKELQKFTSFPSPQEITNEFKQAKSESNLQEQISSHLSQIDATSKSLVSRSVDGIFKKQQRISAMLAYLNNQSREYPKIANDLQFVTKITEDPLGCIMEYLQMSQKQLITTNPFKMLSSYSELETDVSEYQFERSIPNLSFDYYSRATNSNPCSMHYLDTLRKKLIIVDIDSVSSEFGGKGEGMREFIRGPNYEEIDLSGERRIAPLAKSISTPKGEIYVIGGLRSKSVLHLIPKSQPFTSIAKAELPYDKYGMGLLYVEPGVIYSIGGITSRNSRLVPTGQCERYFIGEDKWEQIPSLTLPASQPGLCLYANRYIYKFGGYITEDGRPNNLIEEFDLYIEKWKELRVTDFNGAQMLPKSIGLQINEDQVILLGGSSYFSSTGSYFALNLRNRWNQHSHDEYHQDFSDLIQPLDDIASLEGYEIVSHAIQNQKLYLFAVFQKSESLEKKVLVLDRNFFQIERA